jgi:hypothetical protein
MSWRAGLFRHGERAGVRGGRLRRRWTMPLPLTPTLSPRKSGEREFSWWVAP